MRLTRKKFFLALVFAAAIFAASFVFGAAITATLGPGTSGIATVLITTVLIVIGARIIREIGMFTVMVVAFAAFCIPTTIFGPPGPLKLFVGLAVGLVYDVIWAIGRGRPQISLPVAAAITTAISIWVIYLLMVLIDYPKHEYLRSVIFWLTPVYGVLGAFGAIIGNWIFDKTLSSISFVRSLQD